MPRKLIFADRTEAGALLAEKVAALELADPVVLALPRGGVPVAAEIAARLGAPLDVAFVRKLGAPAQPELAIGAVADGDSPEIVVNHKIVAALDVDESFIAAEAARELAVLDRRRREYAAFRPDVPLTGRSVIVVDDGVATGMTMRAALRSVRKKEPARLIAAVPVASREAARMLAREADAVVYLGAARNFGAVGAYYREFGQLGEEDVARLLRAAMERTSVAARASK